MRQGGAGALRPGIAESVRDPAGVLQRNYLPIERPSRALDAVPVVVSSLLHHVRIDERADGPCTAAFVYFEPPRVTGVPKLPLVHEVCRSHDDSILPQPGRGAV